VMTAGGEVVEFDKKEVAEQTEKMNQLLEVETSKLEAAKAAQKRANQNTEGPPAKKKSEVIDKELEEVIKDWETDDEF